MNKQAYDKAYALGVQRALQDAGFSKIAISLGGIGEMVTKNPALTGAALGGGAGAVSGMTGEQEGAGPLGIGGKSRARMIAERALLGAGLGGLTGGMVGHFGPGVARSMEELTGFGSHIPSA